MLTDNPYKQPTEPRSGMTAVVIGVGSNDPRRRTENVERAIEMLGSRLLTCQRASRVYITPPMSGHGEDYANAVVTGYATCGADQLEAALKAYELSQGRDADARASGRVPVDLDLVVYGDRCLRPGEFSRAYFIPGASELGLIPWS